MTTTHNELLTPAQIGAIRLKHRIVMPPLSRLRAEWPSGVPSKLMLEYYSQRASDGGLIFTEATAIAPTARGYRGAPGIYSDEQVAGWKQITDGVLKPSFSQPSPDRALETAEIADIIEQYRVAARNAKKAGFDGVELMAANGHLIDQFLQDNSNKRTDRYGGTIENRARLLCEAVEALVAVWGADRVGVRIAPSGTFNGMADSNPRALFRYVAERLNDFKLAYLHIIEPRIKGGEVIVEGQGPVAAQELSKIFHGPIIAAGGFEPDAAEAIVANGDANLIAFGRHFIANPDLPKRIALGLPFNSYDRSTFYGFDARGYTDYPTHKTRESDQVCTG
jgi:N-ethylmaleimide reductase